METHPFLEQLLAKALSKPGHLIFAEGDSARVQEAAQKLISAGLPEPYLLKNPEEHADFEQAAQLYAELRKTTLEEAREKTKDSHVFATLLLKMGQFDGMVTGPEATSKERILPALQLIKTDSPTHKASSFFLMILPKTVDADAANGGVLIFADCALNIEPDVPTLAQIAIDSARSAQNLGLSPKVALLSFSTAGSNPDVHAQSMHEAAELAQKMAPDLLIEGELQADAALIDRIGESKDPGSLVAGHANVMIFPDLESGNIAYKMVERLAGAQAIGPLLQGLQKPVNEASRGSSAEDLFWIAIITHILTQDS